MKRVTNSIPGIIKIMSIRGITTIALIVGVGGVCGGALGQAAPVKPADPATVKPESPARSGDAEPSKSLDDILGIPSAPGAATKPSTVPPTGSGDAQPALDKARDRVEKALDEKALEDLMRQALGGMRVSAERLAKETDVGLGTQRVQQDVIAKLDTLIDEAKKRCKGGQSSGGGQCNNPSQGQKSGQKPGSKPGDKEGAQKPGESKTKQNPKKPGEAAGSSASGGGAEPAPQDPVDGGKMLDESQSEWGNLPERVRDVIRQGSRDRIASLYQRLTEEYYRRMAEDASK